VRLQLFETPSESVQGPRQSRENQGHGQSSNDEPDEPKLPLEDRVVGLFDETDHSAANLSNVKGMLVVQNTTDAANTAITIGGSDKFALVCGYVEQLMKIGDVVSKVGTKTEATRPSLLTSSNSASQIHPWASLAWSILSVIPEVCSKSCSSLTNFGHDF
jgi:hypothetical protein